MTLQGLNYLPNCWIWLKPLRYVHDVWAQSRISEGWTYGEQRNDEKRQTPCLVDYDHLSEEEKAYDRITSIETLRLIMKLGFKITKDN